MDPDLVKEDISEFEKYCEILLFYSFTLPLTLSLWSSNNALTQK